MRHEAVSKVAVRRDRLKLTEPEHPLDLGPALAPWGHAALPPGLPQSERQHRTRTDRGDKGAWAHRTPALAANSPHIDFSAEDPLSRSGPFFQFSAVGGAYNEHVYVMGDRPGPAGVTSRP